MVLMLMSARRNRPAASLCRRRLRVRRSSIRRRRVQTPDASPRRSSLGHRRRRRRWRRSFASRGVSVCSCFCRFFSIPSAIGVPGREIPKKKKSIKRGDKTNPRVSVHFHGVRFVDSPSSLDPNDERKGPRHPTRTTTSPTGGTTTTTTTTTPGRTDDDGTNRRRRFSSTPRAVVRGYVVVAFVGLSVRKTRVGDARGTAGTNHCLRCRDPVSRRCRVRPTDRRSTRVPRSPFAFAFAFDDDDDDDETVGRKSRDSIPREPTDVERRVIRPILVSREKRCVSRARARVTPDVGRVPRRAFPVPPPTPRTRARASKRRRKKNKN